MLTSSHFLSAITSMQFPVHSLPAATCPASTAYHHSHKLQLTDSALEVCKLQRRFTSLERSAGSISFPLGIRHLGSHRPKSKTRHLSNTIMPLTPDGGSSTTKTVSLPPEVEREIRGLKAVNRILVEKVVELDNLVDKLRKGRKNDTHGRGVSTGFSFRNATLTKLETSQREGMLLLKRMPTRHEREEMIVLTFGTNLRYTWITIQREAIRATRRQLWRQMYPKASPRQNRHTKSRTLPCQTIRVTSHLSTGPKLQKNSLPICRTNASFRGTMTNGTRAGAMLPRQRRILTRKF